VYFHLKTSEDLEVLVLDNDPSKEKFEEVCDLRQPVLFDFYEDEIDKYCNLNSVISNYGAFDIQVRNTQDHTSQLTHLPMTLNACMNIINDDKDSKILSEKNQAFLEETSLIKTLKYNDMFLRPYMVCNCNYDYMFGSNNVRTPLTYNLNYRNFYYANEGKVKVILIPPKYSKYLYCIKDYESFEFCSPVNPWDVQPKYKPDFYKLKTLEIEINKGQCLYIPAYWWYSIQYGESSSISVFQYRTYMNNVAISPQLFMKILQSQNIKRDIVKKAANKDSIAIIENLNNNEKSTKDEKDEKDEQDEKVNTL
jgi:hypothetical protein